MIENRDEVQGAAALFLRHFGEILGGAEHARNSGRIVGCAFEEAIQVRDHDDVFIRHAGKLADDDILFQIGVVSNVPPHVRLETDALCRRVELLNRVAIVVTNRKDWNLTIPDPPAVQVTDVLHIAGDGDVHEYGCCATFLGAANRFPGASGALGFARPHEVAISTQPVGSGIEASVNRVLSFGAASRVELSGTDNQHYEVELARERADALALSADQRVWLVPQRLSVFDEDKNNKLLAKAA